MSSFPPMRCPECKEPMTLHGRHHGKTALYCENKKCTRVFLLAVGGLPGTANEEPTSNQLTPEVTKDAR